MKIPRPLVHLARYLLTAAVGWLVYPLQALVVYALLVLAAIVTGGDPGEALGLFLALIVSGLAGVILTLVVILPATLGGELIGRRLPWPGWRWVFALLIAGVVAFLLSIGLVAVWAALDERSLATAAEVWIVTFVLSVLPFAAATATAYGLAVAPPVLRWVRQRLGSFRDSLRVKRLGGADPGGAPRG